MSQTSQDSDASTKAGKDAKKDNKKENKKDKKNNGGKNSNDAPLSVNGNKNSTNSATSVATGGAANGAKHEAPTKDSSKNSATPTEVPTAARGRLDSQTEVSSKDIRASTTPAQSAGAKVPAPTDSKNRSKDEMSSSDAKSSKAPIRGAEDNLKGLKAASATHSSANSHLSDGHSGQSAPSGTLADLKKQRAKRMQDALVASGGAPRENGKPAASISNASNGNVIDANDRNANSIAPRRSLSSGDKPQRKYSNAQEVVEGEDQRCCIIL